MKFTKGKDLSKHSDKDLACILGPSRSENATPSNSAPQSKVGLGKLKALHWLPLIQDQILNAYNSS